MPEHPASDAHPDDIPPELGGHLLVAHPGIEDPHFFRSVVLLSAHKEAMGAMGVVVNRPLGAVLGHRDPDHAFGPLADVPLYEGGPVGKDQVLLVGWRRLEHQASFEVYFGVDEEGAADLLREFPELELRAFMGYAGWSAGQLEAELEQGGWAVLPVPDALLAATIEPEAMWRACAAQTVPEWVLLADSPDDASLN